MPRQNIFFDQNVYPDKTVDQGKVNQLFGLIPSGDYNKIANFVLNNNMTFNVQTKDGENALHKILKTSDNVLDKKSKLKLIFFFLQRSVSPGALNKYGITPLHMACKYNLCDISKLLLKYGAEINQEDNQDMIPLHYAVHGNVVKCKEKIRVGALIPKAEPGKRISSEEITKLAKIFQDVLAGKESTFKDSDEKDNTFPQINGINKILEHMCNTIASSDKYFKDEFEKNKEDFNKKLGNIDSKKLSTNNFFKEIQGKIKSNLKTKYKKALEPLEIAPGQPETGWVIEFGGDNPPMPPRSRRLFTDSINNVPPLPTIHNNNYPIMAPTNPKSELYDKYEEINTIADTIHSELNDNFGIIDKYIEKSINNDPRNFGIDDYIDRTVKNIYELLYAVREINNGETTVSDYLNLMGDTLVDKEPDREDIEINNGTGDIDIPKFPADPHTNNPLTLPNIRLNNSLDFREGTLNNDPILLPSPYPDRINTNGNDSDTYENKNTVFTLPVGNNKYNILHFIIYSVNQIKKCLKIIKKFIDPVEKQIVDHFEEKYYYEIYNTFIANIVCEIQNIVYLLSFMNNKINIAIKKFQNIKDHAQKRMQEGDTNNHYGLNNTIIHNYIINNVNKIIKNLNNIRNIGDEIYKNFTPVIDLLNRIINLINKGSSYKIMDAYRKGFQDFNNIQINNIFKEQLTNIKKLPDVIPEHFDENKRDIKYLEDSILLNSGGLEYYNSLNINVKDLPNIHNFTTRPPRTTQITNQYGYLYRSKENNNPNAEINYIQNPLSITLQNSQLSISPTLLGDHLSFLKYELVVKVLNKITGIGSTYDTNPLIQIVDKHVEAMNLTGKKKTEYALVVIGTVLETTINQYMKICIDKKANNFADSLVRGKNTRHVTFSDDIDIKIIGGNKVEITLDDQEFKLNFTEIFDTVIKYFEEKGDFNGLFKSTLVMKDNDELNENRKINKFQDYVWSINYHSGNTTFEKKCFEIEPKLVRTLLKNKSEVNKMDNVGNTPIYYVINIQYNDLIDDLINAGAYIIGIKNMVNQTPLDYVVSLFREHNKVFWDEETEDLGKKVKNSLYNNLCKSYYDNIFNKIKDNFKNNVIQFMDVALPMSIIMYNQFLFNKIRTKLPFTKQKELIEILKKSIGDQTNYHRKFSFLDLDEKDIEKIVLGGKNLHVLDKHVNKGKDAEGIEKYNKDKNEEIEKREKRIEDFKGEINRISKMDSLGNDKSLDNSYKKYLKKEIEKLNKEIKDISNNKIDVASKINTNLESRKKKLVGEFSDNLDNIRKNHQLHRFNPNNDIHKSYTKIYSNVSNIDTRKDWRMYNKMWNNYTKSERAFSIENIHLVLSKFISDNLTELEGMDFINPLSDKEQNKINDMSGNFTVLKDVYEILAEVAEDYNTLPPKTYDKNSNYVLFNFVNNCKHIIHHIATRSMYYTIIKLIYKYVQEKYNVDKDSKDEDREKLNKKVDDIIKDKSSGKSLNDYLNNIDYKLEEKIIKSVLKIYTGDYDPDREFDIDSIFGQITDILIQNQAFPMDAESQIITYLDEHIYPYYKTAIYKPLIEQMYSLFGTYNRYILNEQRHVVLLGNLLGKLAK